MKIRLFFFAVLFAFSSCGLFAQQEKTIHYDQVGFNFSSLSSFGLHFKTGSEKTMFRATVLFLNMANNKNWGRPQDSIDIKSQNYGAGIRAGFEKHVVLAPHFNLIWGLEAGCNYTYSKQSRAQRGATYTENSSWSIVPMIDVVLGATYTISDHLVIGAEITPYIQYAYGKTKNPTYSLPTEITNTSFSFGMSSNSASLSVAYRFGK